MNNEAYKIDEETLAQMNGKYRMPSDAGPAMIEAYNAGIDLSLIDHSLSLTPEQRLDEHQRVLNFLLEIQEAGKSHSAK